MFTGIPSAPVNLYVAAKDSDSGVVFSTLMLLTFSLNVLIWPANFVSSDFKSSTSLTNPVELSLPVPFLPTVPSNVLTLPFNAFTSPAMSPDAEVVPILDTSPAPLTMYGPELYVTSPDPSVTFISLVRYMIWPILSAVASNFGFLSVTKEPLPSSSSFPLFILYTFTSDSVTTEMICPG